MMAWAGNRKRGRPKWRFMDLDTQEVAVEQEDLEDRRGWKLMICFGDL